MGVGGLFERLLVNQGCMRENFDTLLAGLKFGYTGAGHKDPEGGF